MWGRLGPRFALEAGFLILLAVGAALADLDWVAIVAIMAGGWLLVSLIEVIAARRPPWVPLPAERPPPPAESAAPPEPAPLPEPPALEETQEVEAPAEPRRRRWVPWRRQRDGAESEAAEGEEEAEAVAVAAEEPGEPADEGRQ
jgi:hypothetical protein